MRGTRLGSYDVVRKLGEGGMGTVYLAEHHLIGRKAAVKVLLPELSQSQEVVERFFNEARAATRIQHAGIVDVFDFGVTDEGAYLVMEFLEGEPLSDRMARRGRIPEREALRIARQAASALAAAHREGIIHRDLKPDNLIIVPDSEVPGGERVKILDFGIAKLTGEDADSARKTRTGAIIGTPYYMAPEQCVGAGGELDARVDVYALGCVIYEMLCSAPPFQGNGVGEIIAKHIYEAPPSPRHLAPRASEATASLVMTCLAKDADERFASMDALIFALDAARGEPKARTPDGASNEVSNEASNASPRAADTVAEMAETAPPAAGAAHPEPDLRESGGASQPMPLDSAPSRVAPQKPVGEGAATWRRPLAILGASALVVAALGGAFLSMRDSGMASNGDGAAGARTGDIEGARDPAAEAEAARGGRPAGESALAKESLDARGPARPEVQFAITSEPSGALVQDADGSILGATPLDLEVEKDDDPVVYLLRAPDYEEARVELVADRDREKDVTLEQSAEKTAGEVREPERAPRDHRPDDASREGASDEDERARGDAPSEEEAGRSDDDDGEESEKDEDNDEDDDKDEDPFGSRR